MIQSNCQQLDGFQTGDEITVSFNLKGRKWNDPKGGVKYFNSLQAWRLDKKSTAEPSGDTPPPPDEGWMKDDFSSDNDLPF